MTPRLFHLHYHVPDPERAGQRLSTTGLPLYRRYGRVDGEFVALTPEQRVPDGFRLRLLNVQRGYVNVTVTAGKDVQFDHFGVVTAEFDAVVENADQRPGWSVQSTAPHRTFLVTPWGFRVEVQPAGGDVETTLGAQEDCRFERVTLTTPESELDAVRNGIDAVVGDLSGLNIEAGAEGGVSVPEAAIRGGEIPDCVLRARDLDGRWSISS